MFIGLRNPFKKERPKVVRGFGKGKTKMSDDFKLWSKGLKTFYFNINGEVTRFPDKTECYPFKAVAINEKNAVRKYMNWMSQSDTHQNDTNITPSTGG